MCSNSPPIIESVLGRLLIIALAFSSLTTLVVRVNARTINVYPRQQDALKTALHQAQRFDTIIVHEGIYHESKLAISVPMVVKGLNGAVIDGNGLKGSLVMVESDSVFITGLQLHNVPVSYTEDNAAIKVFSKHHVEITYCKVINGFFGIYLSNSRNCRVANNSLYAMRLLESNSGNGIHCWTCSDILIENNKVNGHRDGVYFEFMHQGTVVNNVCTNNLRYGLHFMFSDSCSYRRNVFERNGAGVAVMFTRFVQMFNNVFKDNWGPTSYGLLLKEIFDSHLSGNKFIRNTIAIHCEGANRILFEYNTFSNNGYAVRMLANCELNTVRNNSFDGNTFDVTTNSRESGNYFASNYWSNYDGYDLDKNGYGDVPHHPVRLYSLLVEQMPSSAILMHTPFINILDLTERVIPTVTPETLVDHSPRMQPPR